MRQAKAGEEGGGLVGSRRQMVKGHRYEKDEEEEPSEGKRGGR